MSEQGPHGPLEVLPKYDYVGPRRDEMQRDHNEIVRLYADQRSQPLPGEIEKSRVFLAIYNNMRLGLMEMGASHGLDLSDRIPSLSEYHLFASKYAAADAFSDNPEVHAAFLEGAQGVNDRTKGMIIVGADSNVAECQNIVHETIHEAAYQAMHADSEGDMLDLKRRGFVISAKALMMMNETWTELVKLDVIENYMDPKYSGKNTLHSYDEGTLLMSHLIERAAATLGVEPYELFRLGEKGMLNGSMEIVRLLIEQSPGAKRELIEASEPQNTMELAELLDLPEAVADIQKLRNGEHYVVAPWMYNHEPELMIA